MKKILIATTALVMTAGVASAEVALSGNARMGVIYDGNLATDKMQFTSRARVVFTMSGETDGGLQFGATFRADQAGAAVGNTAMSGGHVYISGAFGKLAMGDVNSASEKINGQVAGVGLTGLGDMNEIDYLADDIDTGALYTHSIGAFAVALSAHQTTGDEMSVAVGYKTDMYHVGLGYEDQGALNQVTLSGGFNFNGFGIEANFSDRKGAAKNAYAISAAYDMNGVGVTAYYSKNRNFTAGNLAAYGIGGSYDLGGGATVVGGIAKEKGSKAVADFGIAMTF